MYTILYCQATVFKIFGIYYLVSSGLQVCRRRAKLIGFPPPNFLWFHSRKSVILIEWRWLLIPLFTARIWYFFTIDLFSDVVTALFFTVAMCCCCVCMWSSHVYPCTTRQVRSAVNSRLVISHVQWHHIQSLSLNAPRLLFEFWLSAGRPKALFYIYFSSGKQKLLHD